MSAGIELLQALSFTAETAWPVFPRITQKSLVFCFRDKLYKKTLFHNPPSLKNLFRTFSPLLTLISHFDLSL